MADQTSIEWCDSTFNPFIGCTKVSPGCDNCYAARSTPARTLGVVWGPGEPRRRTSESNWENPLKWQRQAAEFHAVHGRRRRVFSASLADVFDNQVPDAWRMDLFKVIADTPDLDWLLVTKRIGNVPKYLQHDGLAFDVIGRNVWLGISVVTQAEADRDIPKLLQIPARVRFLSIEPMLGPVDLESIPWRGMRCSALRGWEGPEHGIHWVICGGESGPNARPMHPDWARSLRDQCAAANVPFLFKQWGEWLPAGQDGAPESDEQEINASDRPLRVGKKAAGRALDGRTHDEFPTRQGDPR